MCPIVLHRSTVQHCTDIIHSVNQKSQMNDFRLSWNHHTVIVTNPVPCTNIFILVLDEDVEVKRKILFNTFIISNDRKKTLQLTKQMAETKFKGLLKSRRWNLTNETAKLSSHFKVNCK